jgi:hypothetical protein
VLDLDYKTATICKEIEERVLILGNKRIGRVVRIEDNEDGTFDGLKRVTVDYDDISGAIAYMEYQSTQPELPPAEKVPEPAAAFGLLTVGVIGALKRKADR